MFVAGEYVQLAIHPPTQGGLRQHSLHCDFQCALRVLFQQLAEWQAEHRTSFVDQGYRLGRAQAGTTLRHQDGQVIITDGPCVEGGEVVGGYSIVDMPDLDRALRIARAFPACPTVEIRPILE